jgi:1-acyl-sn-glycerol-3-phosphate acyltransferase
LSAYYSAIRLAAGAVLGTLSGWEVKGRERIPRSGRLIVASNHVSFWDPPMVGAAISRELHFLAKSELFSTPLVGPLIRMVNAIPIRRGVADMTGMARAIEVLRDGGGLLMFPEGSRMRDGELHPARPGVGMLAVTADCVIVPCHISGSNHPARWLTRRGRVRIWFGPPHHWQDLAGREDDLTPGRALYQRVGDAVMREIAILKTGQMNAASRGAA